MEYWLTLAKDYYIVLLLILYFTLGRFALLVPVVVNIGSVLICVGVVLGIEFIQIPVFYHFFSALNRFFRGLKNTFRRKRVTDEGGEERQEIGEEKQEGFFVRKFGKYGVGGVFAISAFPFKGCGVWSGVLLGKGLDVEKKKLYLAVSLGTVTGIAVILLFGLLFQQVTLSFVEGMDLPPAVRELFQ